MVTFLYDIVACGGYTTTPTKKNITTSTAIDLKFDLTLADRENKPARYFHLVSMKIGHTVLLNTFDPSSDPWMFPSTIEASQLFH